VIEPSGVASPSAVLETLTDLGIRPVTVVGIVDATEFVELHESRMYGSFFEDQVVNSDIVLVNKTDLADEERVKSTLALVERINPAAVIFPAVKAVIPVPFPEVAPRERALGGRPPHFHFETLTLRMTAVREFAFYENLFKDLSRGMYGAVVRAKALARTDKGPFRFDLSFSRIDTASFPQEIQDSRLVIIGEGLKKEMLLLLSKG
jgi:G3E family GTPase